MKNLITLLLAVFFIAGTQDIHAQTKEETEQWINDKMEKLTKENIEVHFTGGSVTFIISEFSLNDGLISIHYTRHDQNGQPEDVKATNTPINLLSSVELYDSERDRVTKNHLFDIWFDSYYINKLNILNNNKQTSRIAFGIYNIEENLAERLVTAFKHYKTFYPTPEKPKEAF